MLYKNNTKQSNKETIRTMSRRTQQQDNPTPSTEPTSTQEGAGNNEFLPKIQKNNYNKFLQELKEGKKHSTI